MEVNQDIKATGTIKLVLRDEDGNVKQEFEFKNLVVDAGLAFMASRLKDASAAVMSHMAVGSGATAAAAGQTALVSEVGRVALTSTAVNAGTITYTASFGAGVATGALTEIGLFNAAAAGTMQCRSVFAVVNKQATDTLSVTWNVTLNG